MSSGDAASPHGKAPRTRIARACENCRARRKKCQPPYPCQGCRDAGLTDCLVRDRARPMRRRRSQQASSAPVEGSSYPARTKFIDTLDDELARIYTERTGESISLAIEERDTHPILSLSTPLPALPAPLPPSSADAMEQFTAHLLPFCSYLTAPRVMALYERYASAPSTLAPDQLALILSCIGLGYVRLQGFQANNRAVYVRPDDRQDVPYFRNAIHVLENWGSASFTSLHALCVLWYYSSLCTTSDTARMVVSWMISQAKELGIHKEDHVLSQSYSPADRADLMFVQILYAHYWATALTGHPPIIRPGEFETMSFRSRPVLDSEIVVVVPRRSLIELLVLNTQIMITLHDAKNPMLSVDWLLRTEERWDTWCQTWVADGRTTGNVYTDPYLGVLWDWGRITLRSVTLGDRRLSMSSLTVLARSAMRIVECYYPIYIALPYNLIWLHVRHVISCAHILLLAYWRFELTRTEAEGALAKILFVLALMEPRWQDQVTEAARKISLVAHALGLAIAPPTPSSAPPPPTVEPTPAANALDPNLFGFGSMLYETFEQAFPDGAGQAQLPAWTIDSLLFNSDYA